MGALSHISNIILDQFQRRFSTCPMRRWNASGTRADDWDCSSGLSFFALAYLSFAGNGPSRIPGISMGQPVAGGWLSRYFSIAFAATAMEKPGSRAFVAGHLAIPVAFVPAHVRVGMRKTFERRYSLAEPHCAYRAFSDTTIAYLDRLVRTPTSGVAPEGFYCGHVRHRAGCSLPHIWATTVPPRRCSGLFRPSGHHFSNRKLLLL